ncbi:hypothetical protein [Segetibacter aerophilus]|uniref:Uncharacterized protein n=1 Tax=Segetibacter aerophilus TaxID=670293 RepID=A0A512BIN4_9BACT|nr:hypothetical protein [Segetibacter aerophilus]GEO11735.1 hypothetical protein SAE01_42310 [Segetibacter aerophilus]
MNKFWQAVLINVAIVYALALFTLGFGDSSGLLIIPIFLSVMEFFLSIPFLVVEKSRNAGKVMMAAAGIIFLIGLGVCTVIPFRLE